jgi:hypothetical protein
MKSGYLSGKDFLFRRDNVNINMKEKRSPVSMEVMPILSIVEMGREAAFSVSHSVRLVRWFISRASGCDTNFRG